MKKLIMTKGLPGSGKTTWAKQYLEEDQNTVLVSKDDLRAMLFNSAFTGKREKFILKMRDYVVSSALEEGKNVIVHDTNFNPIHEQRLRQLATEHQAQFVIQDFTSVLLEQCIHNDLCREDSVGEAVIKKMYNDFIKPKPPKIVNTFGLSFAVICDLDGTLALFGDNNPYERDFLQDEYNTPVGVVLKAMKKNNAKIILVSGRKDTFKDQTVKWLKDHGVEYDELHMRKGDDTRKDVIVKQEIYETHIKGKYNIDFVLDDRDQVVEFWRSIGLTCLQVNYGDF